MSSFNAAKARTKYAMPVWVDAFVRDTLDLSADEIGAFNLILWAMWSRETCDLMDDDRKLAIVARVSPQTWRRRVRPALEPFFQIADGLWINTRLRKEAVKTEKFLRGQSNRKTGSRQKNEAVAHHHVTQLSDTETQNISDKPLKTNDPPLTVDETVERSMERPTQESKSIGSGDGSACAREPSGQPPPTDRERVLKTMGADPISGMCGPNGQMLGRLADMQELRAWQVDLGLTIDDVLAVIADVMAQKASTFRPASFRYFTQAMQRFAADKARPALTPIEGGQNSDRSNSTRRDPKADATEAVVAGFARALAERQC